MCGVGRFFSGVCCCIGALVLAAAAFAQDDLEAPLVVQTASGKVKGRYYKEDTKVFFGVPYAGPVSGSNRWKEASYPEPWNGVLAATAFPPACPQTCLYNHRPWVCPEPNILHDEDCLFLNIFTPKNAKPTSAYPVLVFIQGGGYAYGNAASHSYDGSHLASHSSIIVVTVNYRLGLLANLVYGEGPDSFKGNLGIKDQQLALQWVRDNIAAFGGNRDKVTLSGQSAGATMVAAHLNNKKSSQLFHQVILESNVFGYTFGKLEEDKKDTKECILQLKCGENNDYDCLKKVAVSDILKVQRFCKASKFQFSKWTAPLSWTVMMLWSPVIDEDEVVVDAPLNSTKPMLIGSTAHDGVLFVERPLHLYELDEKDVSDHYDDILLMLFGRKNIDAALKLYPKEPPLSEKLSKMITDLSFHCPALKRAQRSSLNNVPVFVYVFNHAFPVLSTANSAYAACEGLACHCSEGPYVFHSYEAYYTPEEKALAERVSAYWGSFVRSGDPNSPTPQQDYCDSEKMECKKEPDWPEYTSDNSWKSIIINRDSVETTSYPSSLCDALSGYDDRSHLLEGLISALRTVRDLKQLQ